MSGASGTSVSASPASARASRQWSSSMFTTIRASSGRLVTGLSRAASRPDRLARHGRELGFQLLLLQFGFQVRTSGLSRHLQHGPRHRLGTPRPRFDEQELLFNAYAARIHRPTMPADRFSMQQARRPPEPEGLVGHWSGL